MTSRVQLWLRNPESRNKDAKNLFFALLHCLLLQLCIETECRQPVKLNISSDGQLELCGQPADSAGLSMGIVSYWVIISTDSYIRVYI